MPRAVSKFITQLVFLVVTASIVGLSAIALLTSHYGWQWRLELLSHFQVQYWVMTLLLLLLLTLSRRRALIWIGLFCVALLSTQILPWYLPPNWLFPTTGNLRVLVANLNAKNQSYQPVLTLVRQENPDVAVFIEVDDRWVAQLDTLQDLLPYSVGQPNPYHLGLMMYSRLPLTNPQVKFFTPENVSTTAEIAIAGQPLYFVATHPLSPIKHSFFHGRNLQLEEIRQALQEVTLPIVMVGDLNITMWSPYYRRFIRSTGLKDARQGWGILPTWPTGNLFRLPARTAPLFSIPIDHCLISPGLRVAQLRTGGPTGSDHRPIIVDLQVNRAGA